MTEESKITMMDEDEAFLVLTNLAIKFCDNYPEEAYKMYKHETITFAFYECGKIMAKLQKLRGD